MFLSQLFLIILTTASLYLLLAIRALLLQEQAARERVRAGNRLTYRAGQVRIGSYLSDRCTYHELPTKIYNKIAVSMLRKGKCVPVRITQDGQRTRVIFERGRYNGQLAMAGT